MRPVARRLRRAMEATASAFVDGATLIARPFLGSPQMPPKTGDDEEILWHYRAASPLKVARLGTGLPVLVYILLMVVYLTWVPSERIRPPWYVWGPLVLLVLFPIGRVLLVEVALTDRAIRRYTGSLVRFVPRWTYVPYEDVQTATQTNGRDSRVAYHQTGVRVVTDDGEDHFFRTGSDPEGFLETLAERTDGDVIQKADSDTESDAGTADDHGDNESVPDEPYGFISDDSRDDESSRE